MKTTKEKIRTAIENNLVLYYANSLSAYQFIDKYIRVYHNISEEQEEAIHDIFAQSKVVWSKLECDLEGPSKEQNEEMDKHLEEVTKEILQICKLC
jgi:hypothetical protein